MRILFMGSPEFAKIHLEELIKNNFNVVGVFTQPDKIRTRGNKKIPTPVKAFAQENNIEIFDKEDLDSEALDFLNKTQPDIIIVVAYGKFIKKDIRIFPKLGIWNVHPSLLPKYRGAEPIRRALENGDDFTGVTIMKLTGKLDAGPIAMQEKVRIFPEDNYKTLHDKLANLGKHMLVDFLKMIESGKEIELIPQNDSEATYASKIEKNELFINWYDESYRVWNKIRSLDPEPGAKSFLNGKIVKLYEASFLNEITSEIPGKVIGAARDGIIVACGKGCIKIGRIQFPGKKVIRTVDAVNGRLIKVGDVLKRGNEL